MNHKLRDNVLELLPKIEHDGILKFVRSVDLNSFIQPVGLFNYTISYYEVN